MSIDWTKNLVGGRFTVNPSPDNLFFSAMFKEAWSAGMPIFNIQRQGTLRKPEIVDKFIEEGMFKTLQESANPDNGMDSDRVYSRHDSLLEVSFYSNENVNISFDTVNRNLFDRFKKLFDNTVINQELENGIVQCVTAGPTGSLRLTPLGSFNNPLVRVNYEDHIVKGYDHIVSCGNSGSPCGRFVLLSGPPGTGKSYMIRSLVTDIDTADFIFVPAHMSGAISGPGFLPLIINNKSNYNDSGFPERKATVIIIEDADSALVRQGDSSDRISDLLNIGDGIFGELADIRIIATTNADNLKIDEAIKRPGRMCQHLIIDSLKYAKANEVYQILINEKKNLPNNKRNFTLADIYRYARKDGWTLEKEEDTAGGQYI